MPKNLDDQLRAIETRVPSACLLGSGQQDAHEAFLKSTIVRRLSIFAMFFVTTKDLKLSLIMTAAFVILALGVFNEKSSISVLPASLFDDEVTEAEYNLAKDLISKYEKKNT